MNCDKAREILNSIFDGEGHVLAGQAQEHLQKCAACREWHASMTRTVALVRLSEQPQMPDIAAMVSRRLPPHHPAASQPSPAQWRPLVSLLAVVSLLSSLAVVVVSMWVSQLLGGGVVWQAIGAGRTLASALDALLASGKAVLVIGGHVTTGLVNVVVGFGPVLLYAVALNLVIVAAGLLIWRRRPRTTGVCLI